MCALMIIDFTDVHMCRWMYFFLLGVTKCNLFDSRPVGFVAP